MDETKQLLSAILKNLEFTNAKVTATQDELLHFRREFNEFKNEVNERFNAVDERFNAVDERFNAVDERFAAIDDKIDDIRTEIRRNRRSEIGLEHDLDLTIARVEKLESRVY